MIVSAAALLALAFPATPALQDWPTWRGPNHDGSTDVTGLPKELGAKENLRWAAPMPGPSAATPVVVGDRVYVSSVGPEATLVAMCLSLESGEVLWSREAGSGYRPDGEVVDDARLDSRSTYSAPSPVADGERAVFFFGNGDLVAYDPEGEELWRRNLQEDYGDFAFQWTFSASPLPWEGRLYLPVLQRDQPANGRGAEDAESFLLALDPEDGKTLFRHARPSDAVMESRESYATIVPRETAYGAELLVVGGDVLTAHDPSTGEELWRWGTWNPGHREQWWRVVPSPVVGGDVVLACAPKRAPVYAVAPPEGEDGEPRLAWKSEGRRNPVSSDVPTPLFYQGRFFVLSDVHSALSRVHPASGEVEWTIDLPRRALWRSSPTGAGGRIWCVDHSGQVVVVDAASGDVLHTAELGEEGEDQVRSSIAIAHGRVLVRTGTKLWCFG